jgi:Tat protein translocase TatB subunit
MEIQPMFGLGLSEILVILAVALIIIGPKRLPEIARALGKGLAEFRRAANDFKYTLDAEYYDNLDKKAMPTKPGPASPPVQTIPAVEIPAPQPAPIINAAAQPPVATPLAPSAPTNAAQPSNPTEPS